MRTQVAALICVGLLMSTSIPTVMADDDVDCEEMLQRITESIGTGEPIDELLEEFHSTCEDFANDVLNRDCAQDFAEISPDGDDIQIAGASKWEFGAMVEILGFCLSTPMVPGWSDVGHATVPYSTTLTGSWEECKHSPFGGFLNGWHYSFGLHATINSPTYDGRQALGNSEIEFDVGFAQENFPRSSDGTTNRITCESERSSAVGEAIAEANAWVRLQLENVDVAADATLNLVRMADGSHLYTLDWTGICNFEVDFVPGDEELEGNSWAFDCVLSSDDLLSIGDSLVAHVNGGTFELEHGEIL
jgi:hypothetical protein